MNDSHKLYLAWRDAHEMMVEENAEAWARNYQNFQSVLASIAARGNIDVVLSDALENFEEYSEGKEFVDDVDNPIDALAVFQEDIACNLSVLHQETPLSPLISCTELFAIPLCGSEQSIRKIVFSDGFSDLIAKSGVAPKNAQTKILGLVPVCRATDIVMKPQLIHDTTMVMHDFFNKNDDGQIEEKIKKIKSSLHIIDQSSPSFGRNIGGFVALGAFSFKSTDVKTFFNISGTNDAQRENWEVMYTDLVEKSSLLDESDFCDIQFPCSIKEGVAVALSEFILVNLNLQNSVGGMGTDIGKIVISVPDHEDGFCVVEATNSRQEYIGSLRLRAGDLAPYLQDILDFWSQDPDLSSCEILLTSEPPHPGHKVSFH